VDNLEASRFAQENGPVHMFSRCASVSIKASFLCIPSLFLVFFVADLLFLEASAFSGDAVDEAFYRCAQSVLNKYESGWFPCILPSMLSLIIFLSHVVSPGKLKLDTMPQVPELDFKEEKKTDDSSSCAC
jgi:hypothetical protein